MNKKEENSHLQEYLECSEKANEALFNYGNDLMNRNCNILTCEFIKSLKNILIQIYETSEILKSFLQKAMTNNGNKR